MQNNYYCVFHIASTIQGCKILVVHNLQVYWFLKNDFTCIYIASRLLF